MPKQVIDVKEFMTLVSKPEIKSIKIKKDTKEVKFKAKTETTLYTLVVKDLEKASKIESNMKNLSVKVTVY